MVLHVEYKPQGGQMGRRKTYHGPRIGLPVTARTEAQLVLCHHGQVDYLWPTMKPLRIKPSSQLADVHYEIRGPLARRAAELEKAGHEIIKLNIGNPGAFGFRAPETMRQAMIENMRESDAYCHQKGIF